MPCGNDHLRVLYACGHVKLQCRCMGPKFVERLREPCPACARAGAPGGSGGEFVDDPRERDRLMADTEPR